MCDDILVTCSEITHSAVPLRSTELFILFWLIVLVFQLPALDQTAGRDSWEHGWAFSSLTARYVSQELVETKHRATMSMNTGLTFMRSDKYDSK